MKDFHKGFHGGYIRYVRTLFPTTDRLSRHCHDIRQICLGHAVVLSFEFQAFAEAKLFYSVLLSMVMIVKTGKLHQKIDLCFKFNPNPRKVKQQFFINVATCKIKLQMVINSDQQGLNRRPCRDTIRGQ